MVKCASTGFPALPLIGRMSCGQAENAITRFISARSETAPPRPVPGGYVRLRAEMDLVIAFSACPQDILPINGKAGKPVEAHFTVTGEAAGAKT